MRNCMEAGELFLKHWLHYTQLKLHSPDFLSFTFSLLLRHRSWLMEVASNNKSNAFSVSPPSSLLSDLFYISLLSSRMKTPNSVSLSTQGLSFRILVLQHLIFCLVLRKENENIQCSSLVISCLKNTWFYLVELQINGSFMVINDQIFWFKACVN